MLALRSLLAFGLAVAWVPAAFGQSVKRKPDSGKFTLSIQENEIGSTTFRSDAEGGTVYDTKISFAGQKADAHTEAKAKAGKLTQVSMDSKPGGKYVAELNGAKSFVSVNGAKPKPGKMPEKLFLFDNYAPHVLSEMLRAYNSAKGGIQNVDLFLVNAGIPLKGTLVDRGTKPRPGKDGLLPVSQFTLGMAGGAGRVEMEIYADSDFRVLYWEVASQKYVAWREGFKGLLKSEKAEDPLLSKPTYEVITETKVMMPLRDGVKLATDVYRPKEAGKYPVILQRTPYGRSKALEAMFYAKRGYVFVAQDVRGKFDSEGVWEPFVNEARDGHDAVEWCGKQEWSNGRVGMIGGTYVGFVQWAAAREGSPYLKCLIPIVSPPDPFFNIPYAFGSVFLYPALWWAAIVKDKGMNAPRALTNIEKMYALPLKDVDKSVFGKTIPFFQKWLQNSKNNAYWDQVNFNDRMAKFAPLPALHISGWFDGDGIGTKRNYARMVAAGQKNQRLVYGAWPHAVNSTTKVGELDFGPKSLKDLDTLYLRWFDRWLKEVENGADTEPAAEAFLMGRNEWRQFSAWPPKEATFQKWYLHSGGKANGAGGDGRLSLETPKAGEKADHFVYNPAKPYGAAQFVAALKKGGTDATLDASAEEGSKDLLVYSSEVLKEDVTVAGPLSLRLTAATSAKDTDWYAYVSDVYPNGKSIALAQGIIRARFRKSFSKPELLKPNEAFTYEIDLWATGNVFRKGHRIRVAVSSSCFPVYDRNLNTGEDIATGVRMVTANQTVFHQAGKESYLLLPVLPN